MAQNQKHDELQDIIDRFSKPGVRPDEVAPAIVILARHLKALEDQARGRSNPDS